MIHQKYQNLLWKIYPAFQFRNEIFNNTIQNLITPQTIWMDIGCGNNSIINQYGKYCKLAIGSDIVKHRKICSGLFIKRDLLKLPLPDEFADLITLRLVVEHLDDIFDGFCDIERVLKIGGKVVILTTNIWSPVIFFPKIIPHNIKKTIIKKIFSEDDQDIFQTFHHFNSPGKIKKGIGRLKLINLTMIEQTSFLNPLVFFIFLIPLLITNNRLLKYFRSNILATFEKV